MKNLYMLQTNICYSNGTYLPYASGTIAAYALSDCEISAAYTLKEIFCIREDINKIVDSVENPAVFSFSCYVWNTQFNLEVAKHIKEKYPSCLIVFGGHNIPEYSTEFLDNYSFIDFLIFGEGEIPFRDLLLCIEKSGDFSDVRSIAFRNGDNVVITSKQDPGDVSLYPSPYVMGLFDPILKKYPEVNFSAILETNRGCPYHCAFCDWCEQNARVRQFSEERVISDIEWMARNGIEFCYCSDANFGIMPRDEKIVDRMIEFKKEFGFPEKFRVNFAKHNNDVVFNITEKLEKSGLNKGATISFQSMNSATLDNIGRNNMPIERFSQLMERYRQAGISTYTEIILGLPGESYEDFCSGIGKLLEAGQHTTLFIYNCELIVNSLMATDTYKERYGIKSSKTPLYLRHNTQSENYINEYSYSVTGTDRMSTEDWIKSNMFSMIVQSCHSMGLLRCFALYLHNENGMSYDSFYRSIQNYAIKNNDTVLGKIYSEFADRFRAVADGNGKWSYVIPQTGEISWPYEEAFYLKLLMQKNSFYSEMRSVLEPLFEDKSICNEIFEYQSVMIKCPGEFTESIKLSHNLYDYFEKSMRLQTAELEHCKNTVIIHDEPVCDDFSAFAQKCIWFGRSTQKNLNTDFEIKYE